MAEKIGILSLQGDFLEHKMILKELDPSLEIINVKYASDIEKIDRLIMPGGESTTMNSLGKKTIREMKLFEALKSRLSHNHLPVLATCAGTILLAQEIKSFPENKSLEPYLSFLPIRVIRNSYGRQQNSFEAQIKVKGFDKTFPGVFIRAPTIEILDDSNVEVIGVLDEQPVLVKKENIIASTFHPELVPDYRIHRLFLELN